MTSPAMTLARIAFATGPFAPDEVTTAIATPGEVAAASTAIASATTVAAQGSSPSSAWIAPGNNVPTTRRNTVADTTTHSTIPVIIATICRALFRRSEALSSPPAVSAIIASANASIGPS